MAASTTRGTLTVTHSTLADNFAERRRDLQRVDTDGHAQHPLGQSRSFSVGGAGILNSIAGTLAVMHSTLSGNAAGFRRRWYRQRWHADGHAQHPLGQLPRSFDGGGISNFGVLHSSTLTIKNAIVAENSASGGDCNVKGSLCHVQCCGRQPRHGQHLPGLYPGHGGRTQP